MKIKSLEDRLKDEDIEIADKKLKEMAGDEPDSPGGEKMKASENDDELVS